MKCFFVNPNIATTLLPMYSLTCCITKEYLTKRQIILFIYTYKIYININIYKIYIFIDHTC